MSPDYDLGPAAAHFARRQSAGDTVTISREEYDSLRRDAELWRRGETRTDLARLLGLTGLADIGDAARIIGEYRALMSSPQGRTMWEEWRAWHRRRAMAESSSAISASEDWSAVAYAPTYKQLVRRRYGDDWTPVTPCDYRMCGADGTPHRTRQTGALIALCGEHSHHGIPERRGAVADRSGTSLGVAA